MARRRVPSERGEATGLCCWTDWAGGRILQHPALTLLRGEQALGSWSPPEDGNSFFHPLATTFRTLHLFCDRAEGSRLPSWSSTRQSFGNKARASWVLSFTFASGRVCSTSSLVAKARNSCLQSLALWCSEQLSASVLSDWGRAQIWAAASGTASRFPVTWLKHSEVIFPVNPEFLKISGETPTSPWKENGRSSNLINKPH